MAHIVGLSCPNCGGPTNREASKCGYCGAGLILLPDGSSFRNKSEMICPKCGTTNERSSWICVDCGTILTKDIEMLKEIQKKVRFEQERVKNSLPSWMKDKLETEEFVHCVYKIYKERSFSVVTDKRIIINWAPFFRSSWIQEAKFSDVVSIGPVKYDAYHGVMWRFEVNTFHGTVLIDGFPDAGNCSIFHSWAVKALENHTQRKKDVRVLIIKLPLGEDADQKEIKKETEIIPTLACHKCKKEIPKGNYMFCPFCGTTLERK